MKLLSVVLPSYNEELNIQRTIDRLSAVLQEASIPYELIFVNDGSRDETWTMIQKAWQERDDVIGIDFSRNFGKEAAILAGLAHANGSCCAVIDCDLQHPPEKLVEMYRLWEQGYDLIEGVKRSRGKESFLHKLCAGGFYWIMSYVTHVDMSRASDFRLMDRKVVDALVSMPERGIFFRALSSWVGFKSTTIEFDVQEREIGDAGLVLAVEGELPARRGPEDAAVDAELVPAHGLPVDDLAVVGDGHGDGVLSVGDVQAVAHVEGSPALRRLRNLQVLVDAGGGPLPAFLEAVFVVIDPGVVPVFRGQAADDGVFHRQHPAVMRRVRADHAGLGKKNAAHEGGA